MQPQNQEQKGNIVKTKVPLLINGEEIISTFIVFPALGKDHAAIAFGDWQNIIASSTPLPIRIHSECLTGDVFHSMRCDCFAQLHETIKAFSENSGLILYLRQEGRGIGLVEKIKAYTLQDEGLNTYEANQKLGHPDDARTYEDAVYMLKTLGIENVSLKSNNPKKIEALKKAGFHVTQRIPTQKHISPYNKGYLETKIAFGHEFIEK